MKVAEALARWRLLRRLRGGGCGGVCAVKVAGAFARGCCQKLLVINVRKGKRFRAKALKS